MTIVARVKPRPDAKGEPNLFFNEYKNQLTRQGASEAAPSWIDRNFRPSGTATEANHETVNLAAKEWAWDDDGDGVREVHINTMEETWRGLRNFLRPFRGVSEWRPAGYGAMFEWAHNLKRVTDGFLATLVGRPRRTTRGS